MTNEFPPVIFVDLIEVKPLTFEQHSDRYRGFANPQLRYREYRDNFQPWRWVAKSEGNQKKLARSTERYFNRSDCVHAIELLFGSGTTVFIREREHGNRRLRQAHNEQSS